MDKKKKAIEITTDPRTGRHRSASIGHRRTNRKLQGATSVFTDHILGLPLAGNRARKKKWQLQERHNLKGFTAPASSRRTGRKAKENDEAGQSLSSADGLQKKKKTKKDKGKPNVKRNTKKQQNMRAATSKEEWENCSLLLYCIFCMTIASVCCSRDVCDACFDRQPSGRSK